MNSPENCNGTMTVLYMFNGLNNNGNLPKWLYRGYTGHEMLDEFALINMNGRMYDPIIGQMLSPDPILDENKYLDHNLYSYAYSNPIKYFDPSGWVEKHIPFGNYSEESYYQFDDATDGRWYKKVAEGNESDNKGSAISREAADEMSEEEFLKTLEGYVFTNVVVTPKDKKGAKGDEGKSGEINHDYVDFAVSVLGGVQNVIAEAAGRAELISKVAAKRIAFVGVAYTAIDIAHASQTGNFNTSHKIDGTITAVLAGFALLNPAGFLALTIYGGARMIGGAAFDEMINEQFPSK